MVKQLIYLLYQDCALCGPDAEQVLELARVNNVELMKVPFYTKAGRDLILEASKHGYKGLPVFCRIEDRPPEPEPAFYFSYNLADLLKNGFGYVPAEPAGDGLVKATVGLKKTPKKKGKKNVYKK